MKEYLQQKKTLEHNILEDLKKYTFIHVNIKLLTQLIICTQ